MSGAILLQPPPPTSPLLALINLLFIGSILFAIAILASRRSTSQKRLIEGFEFMHEVEPLLPFEPPEFYYLF